jgi:pectate lyase
MLFGAHPEDTFDTVMQVTVAYNHFGTGLTQRMPRYFPLFLRISLTLIIVWLLFETWKLGIENLIGGMDLI